MTKDSTTMTYNDDSVFENLFHKNQLINSVKNIKSAEAFIGLFLEESFKIYSKEKRGAADLFIDDDDTKKIINASLGGEMLNVMEKNIPEALDKTEISNIVKILRSNMSNYVEALDHEIPSRTFNTHNISEDIMSPDYDYENDTKYQTQDSALPSEKDTEKDIKQIAKKSQFVKVGKFLQGKGDLEEKGSSAWKVVAKFCKKVLKNEDLANYFEEKHKKRSAHKAVDKIAKKLNIKDHISKETVEKYAVAPGKTGRVKSGEKGRQK